MLRNQRSATQALQGRSHTVAMALARLGLVARQRHALTVLLDPCANPGQRRGLLRKAVALIDGEQCVVVGLDLELATLCRGDPKLGQVFVADADTITGLPEGALGKTVFPAERIAAHVAHDGD